MKNLIALIISRPILTIKKLKSNIIIYFSTYDLSTAQNPFSSVRLLPEADSSKLNHSKLKSEGIDFVVHPKNKRDKFFENIGNWYRIWFEREKCRFQPNVGIRIPNEIDDQNATFYPTMIHSR